MRRQGRVERLLLAFHPSDRTVIALLTLTVVVATILVAVDGQQMWPHLGVHAGLLFGFVCFAAVWIRWDQRRWVPLLRAGITVGVMFTLYTTLGKLGFVAIPYLGDAALSRLDEILFRTNPAFWVQQYQTPGLVEFFSFIYAAFIPYVYLSIAHGCLWRPPLQRDQFLTGWVLTYAISYLGYLFVPAYGPIVYHAEEFSSSLQGGFFHAIVLRGIETGGGPHGAFPSLHVACSAYLCLFDLKTNQLRGLTYLPMIVLIYVSTIVLRYHYVVDLIAGTVIAVICIVVGERVFNRWARRRESAGLPSLPGGEGLVA